MPKFTAVGVGVGLCLVLTGMFSFPRRDTSLKLYLSRPGSLLLAIYLFYLIYAVCSLTWAVNPQLALANIAKNGLAYAILPIVILFGLSNAQFLLIMKGLALGAASCGLVALLLWVSGHTPDITFAAPAWSFLNRNFLASYCMIAFPASVVLWMRAQGRGGKWLYGGATLCLLLFIFHSFSRASWLAVLTEITLLGVFVFRQLKKSKRGLHPLVKRGPEFLIFALVFFAGTFINDGRFESRLKEISPRIEDALPMQENTADTTGENSTGGSFQTRLKYWQNILVMARDNLPLGVAEGNFQVLYPKYDGAVYPTRFNTIKTNLRYAHNEYLEIVTELGVGGLFILLGLLGVFLHNLMDFIRHDEDRLTSLIRFAGIAGIVGVIVNTLASSVLNWPLHNFALACLCCFALPRRSSDIKIFRPWRLCGPLVTLTGAACVLLVLVHFKDRLQFERQFQTCRQLYNEGFTNEAMHNLEDVCERVPLDQRANQQYAHVLCMNGEFEKSLRYSGRIAEVYPYDFRNNFNVGLACAQTGDREGAIAAFERCLTVVRDIQTSLKLAVLLRDSDMERSDRLLASVCEREEAPALAYILKAENEILQNQRKKSAKTLLEGWRHFPGNAEIKKTFNDFGFTTQARQE
ncbi:MAG: O-antigen ligase family protein [Verrucomicrobiota bacterium JB024]|nr:O-antigen ligase family protein [Verrucomicrobiota bacterium JB024]